MKRQIALGAVASVAASVFVAGLAQAVTAPGDVAFKDGAVAMSLTGQPGSADAGKKVFTTRSEGNCIACHKVSALKDVQFPGNIGPVLDGVGSAYSEAQLRGIVVNAKHMFDGTMMPSFYKVSGFIRPGDDYTGKPAKEIKPILSAQQVEDVVAFLQTLKN
ncbi:sulfur oxidation c-type cytochrome SoxX [Acidimangrovimonas sediminis]|uniref:sulfur oxidation c-type cytochrome SoxX n=1 Tax=Acidimangrovimonas sediminis TaxID=2056283 RepID=UPI000C8010A1|nr:sulfur oxidation c-type cytochrome SoxX [Acidimangrovimonas sediminis]